ncbi:MAG: hypothetical protein V9F46_06140, partial [Chitinophagaceae bacterium]
LSKTTNPFQPLLSRDLVLARSSVRYEQLLIEGVDAVILRNGSAHDLQDALSRLAQDTIDQQT